MEAPKKLYDTNVLIEARRSKKPLFGYTTILNLIEYPKATFFELIFLYPSKEEYKLAVKISKELVKRGNPIPAVDILIAAIALNRNLTLVTKDKHFLLIKDLYPELKVEIWEE
ncbi:type II toxin-antitoxin system VapC family toxin [Thermococcus sp.]